MNSRNHNFSSEKVALVGRSGRGKSTFQRQLIRGWPYQRLFVFDHKGEFARLLPAFQCETEAHILACINQGKPVVFNPSFAFPGKTKEAFALFCALVFDKCQRLPGRKLFAFDECGLLVPRHPIRYEQHPIRAIAETGREWEIDMCFAAQMPTQVCTELRLQVSKWIVFQLSGKAVEPLVDECGFDPNAITGQRKGQFLCYDAESGDVTKGESSPE